MTIPTCSSVRLITACAIVAMLAASTEAQTPARYSPELAPGGPPLPGPTPAQLIAAKYASMGGVTGVLGPATSAVLQLPNGAGYYQRYTSGAIFSTLAGTHEIHGPIWSRYAGLLAAVRSQIGYPITDVLSAAEGGTASQFRNGSFNTVIYSKAGVGTFYVWGLILGRFLAMGGPAALGYPLTDEVSGVADPAMRYNYFQRGTVTWKSSLGAHEVHGEIWKKYIALGGPEGFLRAAQTDESATPDGTGRYNHFEGGSIYWTPSTGAHEVHGLIRQHWAYLGWERSFLGYPLSDETVTPNLIINGSPQGRFNQFQHGRIYWTPDSGAVEVADVAEIWQPDQKGNFRASLTGTRPILTILYNPYVSPHDINPKCTADNPRCNDTAVLPMPTVSDVQYALFGTRPNEPPPNPSNQKSNVSDYYFENSQRKMNLINAGIVSVDAPLSKRGHHYWDDSKHVTVDNDGWINGHGERDHDAIMGAAAKGFNFKAYDSNHDGLVTTEELAIIVLVPGTGDWGDAVRVYGSWTANKQTDLKVGGVDGVTVFDIVEWFTHAPTSGDPISLGLIAHELGHLMVGVPDFYNSSDWNFYAGAFSVMSTLPSSCCSVHLDPFAKLKAKWLNYQVVAGSGAYTYMLKNVELHGEVVILYDPSRGRDEYFILEYRRPGTSYDAGRPQAAASGLPDSGLAVWHIVETEARRGTLPFPADASKWNWYERGVLLVRAAAGTDDRKALFTSASAPLFLTWADGTSTGFKVAVKTSFPAPIPSVGGGSAGVSGSLPDAIELSITR